MSKKIFLILLPFWIVQFFITLFFDFGRHYGEIPTYLTENYNGLSVYFSVIIMPLLIGVIMASSNLKIPTAALAGASISLGTFLAYFINTFTVVPISTFFEAPLFALSYFLTALISISALILPLHIATQAVFSSLSAFITRIILRKLNPETENGRKH